MDLWNYVEMVQQQIVIGATIYQGVHMVGATKKICYDAVYVRVGTIWNNIVIFAHVSGIMLIVIHKS